MKTFSEVERWCLGAARQFGDPAIPVGHAFFRHVENILDYRADNDLVFSTDGQEVTLLFAYGNPVVIAVNEDAPEFDGDELVGFGVKHIADGLWALTPSLNMPGLIHLFVTLYDVPRVAPWQKPVLILGGLRGAEVFTAQYLERRTREHHEWREVEQRRDSRAEVVREVAIAIRQHLDAAASTRQLMPEWY